MATFLAPIATLVVGLHKRRMRPLYSRNPGLYSRVTQEKNVTRSIPGIQGLVADPPNLSLSQECLSTFEQELLGQLYNVFLILVKLAKLSIFLQPPQLVTLLSLKFRGVRQNYREALYIGFAMGLNTTVWVFWVLTGFIVPDPYRWAPTRSYY